MDFLDALILASFFGNLIILVYKMYNVIFLLNTIKERPAYNNKLLREKQIFTALLLFSASILCFVISLGTLGNYISLGDIANVSTLTLLHKLNRLFMVLSFMVTVIEILLAYPMSIARDRGKPIERTNINKPIF